MGFSIQGIQSPVSGYKNPPWTSRYAMSEFDKTFYTIGEVSRKTGIEPHVLRYWESEFPQLRPKKNRAGNRAYRIRDIELLSVIKHLLYEEKFTISGAKKKLSSRRASRTNPESNNSNGGLNVKSLQDLVKQLESVLTVLES